ncbi:hypothetical protein F4810DRAFT_311942 [Camillea tinctor]|nr:hypothetical protein F4810DRAFT_311942 [Camillea tinctor]
MKNGVTLVALAAGLSQVVATGFGFHNAPSFSCPSNTDNTCTDDQKSGFNWSGLDFGSFSSYKGFDYSGFTCSQKFGKRDTLTGRSFQSKCISGKATGDKGSSPKISCDKTTVKKTSIKEFQVTPEFDCDLEFHYSMPDGSTCKHRSACKASGTTVQNTQCGGATDVTIVYPSQPEKGKDSCDFGVHSIGFDCAGPSPSKPAPSTTATPSYPAGTPSVSTTRVKSSSASVSIPAGSTSVSTSEVKSSSSTAVKSSGTPSFGYPTGSVPATSSVPATGSVPATSSVPAQSTGSTAVVSSSTSVATSSVGTSSVPATGVETPSYGVSTSSAATPSVPAESTGSTAVVSSTVSVATSFSVTSYLSTSTVFTTSVQTITSCGPTVTNCPASSTALTTVTIPVSTTLCPVTETLSVPATQGTVPAGSPSSAAETPSAPGAPAESTIATTATSPADSTSSTPAGPVETLPCPDVVPSCLNTWMFSVGCSSNTDSGCYCPDNAFVQSVFSCLYAHGESDEVISEAISYFQGICAPYVSTNPGIATGAETITSVLTAQPTTAPAAVTTIQIVATTVVPCTDDTGVEIPSSSSTVTISTSITVPEVHFSTITAGPGTSAVGVVPGTSPVAQPTATAPGATATAAVPGSGSGSGSGNTAAPYPTAAVTTLSTAAAASTGFLPTTSAPAFVTGAAPRVGTGLGFLGMVAMAVAAL